MPCSQHPSKDPDARKVGSLDKIKKKPLYASFELSK